MNDVELLKQELRAAREEMVRMDGDDEEDWMEPAGRLPLMPERDPTFLRLSLMNAVQLERHVERLERDIADAQEGFDRDGMADDR